jgi:endonuclease YncB( thermonuclease family)
MILRCAGFGLGRKLALPAVAFATGLALGAAIVGGRAMAPLQANAAASPIVVAAIPPVSPSTRYPVEVLRVIDGDTFEARVRVWPAIEIATKVRLRNIDAPELRGNCERNYAIAARHALASLLGEGTVSITDVGVDKYGGRVLAQAATARTNDVSAALLQAGLVRRYSGGRREPWC